MTEKEFKQAFVMLYANYNQKPDPEKIAALAFFVGRSVGFAHDWGLIATKIAENEQFHPTTATITQYVRQHSKTANKNANEAAQEFVDRAIMGLTGPAVDYAGLGKDGYALWKKVVGMGKYDMAINNINPSMMRKIWVEMFEGYFERSPQSIQTVMALPKASELHFLPAVNTEPEAELSKVDAQKMLGELSKRIGSSKQIETKPIPVPESREVIFSEEKIAKAKELAKTLINGGS